MLASNIKTSETRYGRMSYYGDDQFVGHALDRYGEYSEDEVALWRRIIQQGDSVVEVGANIGALTLALADIVGTFGRVVAFEAQPENFALLDRNVKDNAAFRDLEFVSVHETAIGSSAGTIAVPELAGLSHKNFGGVEIGRGAFVATMRTLDSFALEAVDFIKIDVEGMEADVIEGARETIARCRPLLYVENDRPEKSNALIELLRSLDYRLLYDHRPALYGLYNFKKARIDGEPQIVSLNVLAIPKGREKEFADVTATLDRIVPIEHSPRCGGKWAGIVRFGGIGDNLIAASVLRPLKAMGYKIDVLTSAPQHVVFENNPFIDKLSVKVPLRDLPQGGGLDWQKWFWSRGKEYDRFVNLSHSCEHLLAQFPASTAYWWPAEWRRKHCGQSYLEAVHEIAGVPFDFGPLFFPTDEEREIAHETRRKIGAKRIIGWCIAGTRVDKVYPQAPMAVARLIRELDAHVVLMGGPPPGRDFAHATQIHEHVREQNGSDAGLHIAASHDPANPTWPIRRLLTFAAACDLVIGPDTGPMWAVAMEPVPKIMLHSHASVENICAHWVNTVSLHADPRAVPCWPCHMLHDGPETCVETQTVAGITIDPEAKGAACIRSISVETILSTAAKMLGA